MGLIQSVSFRCGGLYRALLKNKTANEATFSTHVFIFSPCVNQICYMVL